ncbi:putative LRR receptor-like serine/threonine-protein kinase isoform B [Glycine soja]|uniref:Putative LRR receptor-like serine/threonine-protein kinase isoform B n=2 Tax=Glycine soja TaxID=3848 RepID=A0A445LRU0_GLYSO|nr:putative LRR receptor-like serine/threonine-protein kinase isoform B [Glycine soja]
MGLGVFGSVLVLALLFKHLASQQPNTDEFFVSEFLKKMGLASSQGYNFSASVCSWQGVSCDANGEHIVDLVFSGMDLSGTMPDNTIGKLSKLQSLDLSHNKITGLPSDFWSLSSLKSLNLSSNQISGSLTNNIGNFGLLESIDLSSNNFSEEIPKAVSSLLSLRVLKLDHNRVLLWMCFREDWRFWTLAETNFKVTFHSCPIAANPRLFKRRDTGNKGMKLALALSFSMIFVLAGLLFLAFGFRRKTKMWEFKQTSYKEEQNISGPFSFQTDSTTWVADIKQATSVPVVIFEKPLLNITFADLLAATSNFDRGTLLAEGKFGPVYRGFLLGGVHVAVKVLVVGSTLTDEEAARELEFLGRIKHPNLVPLTGYCVAGDQRIAIYDYMENGNLQNLLYDLPLGVQSTDDWSTDAWEEADNNGIQNAGSEGLLTSWRFRHKIALGTARALAFLHHGCSPPIIHRAVKASSVYLDYDLEPRLSDSGLAKIFGSGLDDEIVRGSPGYVPPEFTRPELDTPTPKSDVYCFGVVLFELVTGKMPVGDDYPDDKEATLVSWVRGLVRKNQASRAIDPKIHDTGPDEQMEEALKIGYLCTADLPFKRPSMQQIVGLLKDIEPTAS